MSVTLSIEGEGNCLLYWEWYLLLGAVILIVIFYIRWFNMGLKQFSPQHFYAIVAAFWILTIVVGGLVVYREIEDFEDPLSMVMFIIGSTVCILSMICLSQVKPPVKKADVEPVKQELMPNASNRANNVYVPDGI